MIKNGKFCKYHVNEFKVNRDSEGNTIILTKNEKIIDSTFIDKYGRGVYSKKSFIRRNRRVIQMCNICSNKQL